MARKDVRRMFWWLEEWQLAEQEAWLEGMSAQGWHLVKTNIGRATFQRGEPQAFRYRCDVFKADDWYEEERLSLYQEAGWEHVSNRGLVQIFRAPVRAAIPEIHTDPGEHVRNIRKLLPGRVVSLLFPLLLLVIGIYAYGVKLAEVLLGTNWVVIVSALFFLGWVLLNLAALLRLFRYIAQLRRQQRPIRPVHWQKQMRRARVRAALIALALLLIWGEKITSPLLATQPEFPPIPAGDLPVLRLSQILDSDQYAAAIPNRGFFKDKGDVFNFYKQDSSLFVPEQYYLAESVAVPKETGPANPTPDKAYLHCDAYRAVSPGVAKALAKSLAQERRFYPNRSSSPLTAATDTHGFYGLWLLVTDDQHDLVAWLGNWVYYLSYNGKEALELLLHALQYNVVHFNGTP